MSKYVILHGHFYQPPRENPWTGNINHQESAAPFRDWNKRINAECYAAGAASRVLDGAGKILAIVNNYQTLSWNFGPTLLSWMEREAPNVYKRILEADRESRERLGFGNAVAQSFNHTILPLDREEDARTQIIWGLEDFRRRFRRDADGMWLPECAVNDMVLDILIEQGLSYVILSPWQASQIKGSDGKWTKLEGKPGPCDRPFTIRRPSGDIAAFFYNPELASGISFGHLLRSREGFREALDKALENTGGDLITIATDGEIYGHHEPFGDMCLAALSDHQGDEPELVFTNYAAYLANNPATEEVRLSYGDDGLGSSWSCAHGVSRWRCDCGCSTGGQDGWNQKWRTPLRLAYDELRNSAEKIWMETVAKLTGNNSRDVLNDYGRVLAGVTSPAEFASAQLAASPESENSPKNRTLLLEALEGAKYLQFTYTSCGWFFSELSGIEPVQNIRYAYRAVELLDRDGNNGLLTALRKSLKKAHSNIEEKGTAADILDRDVIPTVNPDAAIAASVFFRNLYNLGPTAAEMYDIATGEVTRRTVGTSPEGLELEGEVNFTRISTQRDFSIPYKTRVDSRLFCTGVFVEIYGSWKEVPIGTVSHDIRAAIQNTLLHRTEKYLRKALGNQALTRIRDIRMVQVLNLPLGESHRQTVALNLHYGPRLAMRQLHKLDPAQWPPVLATLDEILDYRGDFDMNDGLEDLESRAGNLVSGLAEEFQAGDDTAVIEQLVNFLEIIHRHGMRPLKPHVQNSVYSLLARHYCDDEDSEADSYSDENLNSLAEMLNINPERFLQGT